MKKHPGTPTYPTPPGTPYGYLARQLDLEFRAEEDARLDALELGVDLTPQDIDY